MSRYGFVPLLFLVTSLFCPPLLGDDPEAFFEKILDSPITLKHLQTAYRQARKRAFRRGHNKQTAEAWDRVILLLDEAIYIGQDIVIENEEGEQLRYVFGSEEWWKEIEERAVFPTDPEGFNPFNKQVEAAKRSLQQHGTTPPMERQVDLVSERCGKRWRRLKHRTTGS